MMSPARAPLATALLVLLTAGSAYAGTDFLTGERTDGLRKICFYQGAGGADGKSGLKGTK